MRISTLCILSILFLSQLFSQSSTSNKTPKWGETITISYKPDSTTTIKKGELLELKYHLLFEDFSRKSETNFIEYKGNQFSLDVIVPRGVACLDFNFYNKSGNPDFRANLQVRPISKNGKYYKNAFIDSFFEQLKELETYPNNFAAYRTRWQLLPQLKPDSASIIIKNELESVKKTKQNTPVFHYAMVIGNTLVKDFDNADTSIEQLIKKYPLHPLTEEAISFYRYQCFAKSHSNKYLNSLLLPYIQKYPQTETAKEHIHLFYKKGNIVDRAAVEQLAGYWVKKEPNNPSMYYRYADALEDESLKRKYLNKAIGILLDKSQKHFEVDNDLSWISKIYDSIGDYGIVDLLFDKIESNSSTHEANFYLKRGIVKAKLNDFKQATFYYLKAEESGHKAARDSARLAFAKLNYPKNGFDKYAFKLMKEDYDKQITHKMPAFEATDMKGNTWKSEDLIGKVVVLNYWFIGCAPCRVEIPGLNEMVEHYKGEDVVFLAFSTDPKANLEGFLKKSPFNYNIIPDAMNHTQNINIKAHPTHIILDKSGNIRAQLVGGSAERHKEIMPLIDRALRY